MIWEKLSTVQLNEIDRHIPVVLPLTAIEQHGPHLPLATDRIIGEYFAMRLHEAIPDDVLVLPGIAVGCSEHHLDFAGTLSVSHQKYSGVIEDILKSVIIHGFRKIILFNSHGGNQAIAQVIIEKLGFRHQDCHFVLATWWNIASDTLKDLTETGPGGTGHAGEFETSLMLHIAPELVSDMLPEKGQHKDAFLWAEADMLTGAKASYYRTMIQKTENGVFGDPSAATADKGIRITKLIVDQLIQIVRDLKDI